MKLCRFDFKTSDGGCVLDGKPCEENCNSIVEIDESPRTVRSVLLERWAKDTEAMASRMIGYDESESKFFTTNIDGEITNRYEHVRLALEAQIAYLNSAAEVGK